MGVCKGMIGGGMKVSLRRFVVAVGLCFVVLLQSGELFANDLELEARPISFPNPALSPACLIEFSYLVNQSGLDFLPDTTTGTEIGGIFAQVVIYDSTSMPIDSAAQSFSVRKSKTVKGARVAGRLRIPLEEGRYSAALTVMDVVSKREATGYFQLPISGPPTEGLSISGIEIAHALTKISEEAAGGDPLAKNGKRVTPNPTGIVSAESDSIRLYIELYNLEANDSGEYRVGWRTELSEPGLEHPFILDEEFITAPGSSIVYARTLVNKIDYSARAVVRFIVTDANTQVTDTSSRSVIFVGAEGFAAVDGELLSPYDSTSAETRENVVYWLLSPHQRDLIKSLTPDGLQQYIERFWLDNDADPTTSANEYRDAAYERFMYATRKYSSSIEIADGWKTDPGRIIMQYGRPDEVTEIAAPIVGNEFTNYDPWERWVYEKVQGGVYFVFVNLRGLGDYRLRGSNAQGEIPLSRDEDSGFDFD